METTALKKFRQDGSISEELQNLLESIGTVKTYPKDTFLFHEGMDANQLFMIKSGLVHISKLTADGKELSLRICSRNSIVGELTLFNNPARFFLTAKVLQQSQVLIIEKDILEKELQSNGLLAIEMMKWCSEHLRKFQTKIKDLLVNGRKGALYSTIIRLSNSYGVHKKDGILIDLPLTNNELATFCACTRESVNRMLGELRKQDIILIDDTGKIFIKNLQYLRDENGCENCPISICNIH